MNIYTLWTASLQYKMSFIIYKAMEIQNNLNIQLVNSLIFWVAVEPY